MSNKIMWHLEEEEEKRSYQDYIEKKSYQPPEDNLPNDDPPRGGSGVPDKDKDRDED
jgi:hypothetical protein